MTYDSRSDTLDHIQRVNELLDETRWALSRRARVHDASKLEGIEKETFDRVTPQLRGLTYGTPEYSRSLADMGPALENHYANNSHHPEHYKNGIDEMSMLDLIEMLADWKAAGERHANGSLRKSLEINKTRFKISPKLYNLLRRTAEELGWLDVA